MGAMEEIKLLQNCHLEREVKDCLDDGTGGSKKRGNSHLPGVEKEKHYPGIV